MFKIGILPTKSWIDRAHNVDQATFVGIDQKLAFALYILKRLDSLQIHHMLDLWSICATWKHFELIDFLLSTLFDKARRGVGFALHGHEFVSRICVRSCLIRLNFPYNLVAALSRRTFKGITNFKNFCIRQVILRVPKL